MQLPLPRMLDKYRLLRVLGRGGMGVVYEAEDTEMHCRRAVKVLTTDGSPDPDRVQRFRREIRALGSLDDPHIVLALDAGAADGQQFLVMEYVDGLSLQQLVDAHGPFGVADAAEVCRQVALGLDRLQTAQFVHRDIKPGNLMLARDGTAKILDLGLVKCLDHADTAGGTPSQILLGTVDYLAPEQAADARAVGIQADVYSLGCALYHLLAGRVPFGDAAHSTLHDKLRAHALEPFPVLDRPDVPVELLELLRQMTAKAPQERPAPGEVVRRLTPLAGAARLTHLLTQVPPPAPLPRRRAPLPLLVALVLAPLLPLLAWAVARAATVVPPAAPALTDLDKLPRGVQHDLLKLPLVPAVWDARDGEPLYHLTPARTLLHVNAPLDALLLFGTTQARDYTFTAVVLQPRLAGGVGLALGYHALAEPPQDQPPQQSAFQFVEVYPEFYHRPGEQRKVVRGLRASDAAPGQNERFWLNENLVAADLPQPARKTTLAVTVANGIVSQVHVNGVPLPRLVESQPAQHPRLRWTRGALGVTLRAASGVVTNVFFQSQE